MEVWDVLVVGAGPAGASAAYFLSRAGQRVLILDKMPLPRYKPCGGGVSLEFLRSIFPFSFHSVIAHPVQEFRYCYLGVDAHVPCRQDSMALVMRDCFDAHILAHSGCEVCTASVWQVREESDQVQVVTEDGRVFSSRFLVAADGAASPIAHGIGLVHRRWLLPALHAEVPASPVLLRRHPAPTFIFEGPRRGYAWIFPKEDHLSIGIGALQVSGKRLKQDFLKIMARQGIALDGCRIHGHPIPLYNGGTQLATRRVLLAGDAAGLVDPFSGEGIRPAVLSGKIAAECILRGEVEQYPTLVRQKIGSVQNISHGVGTFFFLLKELCLALGAPNPFTTQAILDMLANRGTSLDVLIHAMLTLPYFIPVEIAATLIGVMKGNEAETRFRRVVYPA